jgi:hypothetical protein
VITENVPADAMAIARGRQVNLTGRAQSFREQRKKTASKAKPASKSGAKSGTKRKSGR